jgi:pyruvate/2-oxoacid:ferredoxin oxidoreductase alpha subunit
MKTIMPRTAEARPELLSGNRLLAEGALEAGCRFFSGYPITPSSEIYETMMKELPARKGLALAAPDEITALALCVGASLRGYKAMTATSGPGWCLMIETVQYAVMTETPVVVAIVQRLGPSTSARRAATRCPCSRPPPRGSATRWHRPHSTGPNACARRP